MRDSYIKTACHPSNYWRHCVVAMGWWRLCLESGSKVRPMNIRLYAGQSPELNRDRTADATS